MQEPELRIIENLTGVSQSKIEFSDNGFWSRGYVIECGKIVFKFKRTRDFSYQDEIDALNFVNTLGLGVNLQRTHWISPDDSYLGMYGVVGEQLAVISKNNASLNQEFDLDDIARQLGNAIKKLHQATPKTYKKITPDEEIKAWQKCIFNPKNWQALTRFFNDEELEIIENYVRVKAPEELKGLGEKLVFSHGDLHRNNLLIDQNGQVGIIDFYELHMVDEAADFMDMHNNILREKILDIYGADETLRTKVKIRNELRPIYLFASFTERGEKDENLLSLVKRIRQLLESGSIN